jgi:hypothetical protein
MTRFRRKERFRFHSRRQQLAIALLAVGTAAGVLYAVMDVPGRIERLGRPPPDRAPCTTGQTEGCVGGRMDVIVMPADAASAPAAGR